MTKKALPAVDLSFLKGFKFVGGSGRYKNKEVCIMTGLHLAVLIAEGKTTLADAIKPKSAFPGDSSGETHASTSVDCVDSKIVSLAMYVNDSFADSTKGRRARKAWALKTLPRLLGTRGNNRLVHKLDRQFEKDWDEREARRLAQAFLDSKTYEPDLLDEARTAAFGNSDEDDVNVDYQIEKLDYVLTGIGH